MISFGTLMIYILVVCTLLHLVNADGNCAAIISPDIASCMKYGQPNNPSGPCVANTVCKKRFNVTIIDLQPHSNIIIPDILRHVFDVCCGPCTRISVLNTVQDAAKIGLNSSGADFIYPILSYTDLTHIHGYAFLPLIDETHSYYIKRKKTSREYAIRVARSAASLWPLLVICLLMAVIAGFPVWLIETWSNKDEFPRPFLVGLFEGFWWSFVSMTTVGYGDRAPKSLMSRMLAMMWILVGITLCALFTASMTSEITSAYADTDVVLTDSKVGILKGRIYDASIVTNGGGYVIATESSELMPGIFELLEKLENQEVSGFLIDKYTYMHLVQYMHNVSDSQSSGENIQVKFFLEGTTQNEVKRHGQPLGYGMLVKSPRDYEYIRHFVFGNRPFFQTCQELKLHNVKPPQHDEMAGHNIFNPESGLFIQALILSLTIIGAIVFVGILYEVTRWKMRQKATQNGVSNVFRLSARLLLRSSLREVWDASKK